MSQQTNSQQQPVPNHRQSQSLLEQDWSLLNDHKLRRELVKTYGLMMFCLIYLSHYFYRPPAAFHPDLMAKLSDASIKRLLVVGFRGSAKSTLGSVALPIFAALEQPDIYPFIIPIADTGTQAATNIANIKTELDSN